MTAIVSPSSTTASRRRLLIGLLIATLLAAAGLALDDERDGVPDADVVTAAAPARNGATARRGAAAVRTATVTATADAAASAPRTPWPEFAASTPSGWGPPPPPPPKEPTAAELAERRRSQKAAVASTDAASVPPPPPAPPPPYILIGRYDDGSGQALVWLSAAQRMLSAKRGDVLDQQWRVETIGPARIDLVWLRTGETRSLTYPRS